MRGLDVTRPLGLVFERLPDLADAHLEGRVSDEDIGPGGVEQLLLGDEPSGPLDEIAQDVIGLRRHRNDPAVTGELTAGAVQRTPAERQRPLSGRRGGLGSAHRGTDRKSTRLNSSHSQISYAVFCLKKKKKKNSKVSAGK